MDDPFVFSDSCDTCSRDGLVVMSHGKKICRSCDGIAFDNIVNRQKEEWLRATCAER